MRSRLTRLAVAMLGAVTLILTLNAANAAELPEGIKVQILAEYPSRVSKLGTVRLVKVTMQPGAKFDNIVIKHEEYCRLSQGQLSRTNHTLGTAHVITVGAHWAPPKGDRHTVISTGDKAAIMWVYQLIEKGEGKGDSM